MKNKSGLQPHLITYSFHSMCMHAHTHTFTHMHARMHSRTHKPAVVMWVGANDHVCSPANKETGPSKQSRHKRSSYIKANQKLKEVERQHCRSV